jgi:hypothetical protein
MAGLVPAIHVFALHTEEGQDVETRQATGHDDDHQKSRST